MTDSSGSSSSSSSNDLIVEILAIGYHNALNEFWVGIHGPNTSRTWESLPDIPLTRGDENKQDILSWMRKAIEDLEKKGYTIITQSKD